ncbi:MAG: dicarboxylate/amino acid:cation symporter [Nevskiales bacterium]
MKLHWQILLALLLAALVGVAVGYLPEEVQAKCLAVLDFFGTLFLNALKMLIVPLITAAIISGLANLSGGKALGRLGAKTVVYYLASSLLAILTGLLLVNSFVPGVINGQPAGDLLGLAANTGEVLQGIENRGSGDVVGIFLRMLPPNIVAAAAEGQMLGLIMFSLLFGYAITRLPAVLQKTQQDFWNGVYEVMIRITELVMRFAPLGVFALVAEVVAQTGWQALQPVFLFFVTVLAALAFHLLITLPLILRFVAGVSPYRHFQAMSPALLTAFSTSSSSATLPLTIDCVQKRAGVSKRTSSFVLPLGATINMDGTALYECVAVLFIAQAYGLQLDVATQFVVVVTALLTSIGVAGIPSASLVAIAVILGAVGLPLEGIGLILVVDRVLDMCRTAVNVFSDASGAVTIARLEGETKILTGAPVSATEQSADTA